MKKVKTMKVAISAYYDGYGNVEYEYVEIPASLYEQWLKRCYEASGCF